MMDHYEISVKQYQIRFYDENDKENYIACIQLYKDGNKGFLHSLIGKGFYKTVISKAKEIMEKCEITSVEAYVLPLHAKLIEKKLSNILDFEILDEAIVHENRKMCWIKLKEKKK